VAAVHEQVLVVDTLTVPVPALEPTAWLVAEMEYVQEGGGGGVPGGVPEGAPGAAACVTDARWPPIAILPVRSLLPLDPTVKLRVLLPLPDSGGERLIQPTSVVAVHAHSLDVITLTLPDAPSALRL
jgi:hypothetical protein